MSWTADAEKIDLESKIRTRGEELIAIEAPVNIFVNDEYVITLLATPTLKKELAVGWLFNEGVIRSLNEMKQLKATQDSVNIRTKNPIMKEKLRVVGVSRLITTACGLTTSKFYGIINGECGLKVASNYTISVDKIINMSRKLNEGPLYQSTRGVHVAALFEDERLIGFAEDVGRHNTIDKVVGIGVLAKINFAKTLLVSSGRQPADMVLKAARMKIPIIVSKAVPIRSGIISATKTGITLACLMNQQHIYIYTHHNRILTD
ncbi:MAG: formate dehydrogenase accessory sulfurtransferase FdhD [Candidatus Bathyarchaeota archaeon]|nr:MAG: formate dehydrogenase accessory sulfurtransferase FdhD [Candidatus Bathyarchaeota archaeon]